MRKGLLSLSLLLICAIGFAQSTENEETIGFNSAEKLLATQGKLSIGGYGEVHYNQGFDKDNYKNGSLDVHRMVMLFGYNFSSKTQFVTELEFEHVSEVYVEQAFLQHRFNNLLQFRAGLLLIPVGITNEFHEPTAFNGVERPQIDGTIVPTTWREIGMGFTGNYLPASIKYQIYVVNGFKSYDGSGLLGGSKGFRSGRQKGAESIVTYPNFTGKVEYFGVRGLNIGLSGYFGKTQSKLYDNLAKDDANAVAKADSSVVGLGLIGVDARYSLKNIQVKGQLYYASISNSDQYNAFTKSDLGSSMLGYYAEVAYALNGISGSDYSVKPFIRYSNLDTHLSTVGNLATNDKYNKVYITTGLGLELAKGTVLKVDMQFGKSKADDTFSKTLNAGIGVMF